MYIQNPCQAYPKEADGVIAIVLEDLEDLEEREVDYVRDLRLHSPLINYQEHLANMDDSENGFQNQGYQSYDLQPKRARMQKFYEAFECKCARILYFFFREIFDFSEYS